MTCIDLFDRGAGLAPDRAFVIDGARRYSYRDAREWSRAVAATLVEAGLRAGSRAAVWSPNSAEAVLAVLGIIRARATWVALNARTSTDSIGELLELTEPEVLFYHSDFSDEVVELQAMGRAPTWTIPLGGREREPFGEAVNLAVARRRLPFGAEDDVVALLPTGGTTGRSKAVALTNRNLETMAANFFAHLPVRSFPPVHLMSAPFTHGAGLFMLALNGAAATHVMRSGAMPDQILSDIERYRVTHTFLPPTVLYLMLASPALREHDYSSLEHLIYGAAPMSTDKLLACMDVFGDVMTQIFGQIEAPILVSVLTPEDHRRGRAAPHLLTSCGRPTLLTPVAIMDELGTELPIGETGEIVVRGGLVSPGYFRDPEATSAVRTGPWHRTGDLGHLDEEGFLYIVDRKRDLIITGGFNVFPSEVEQVLWAHPAVQDCAVIGLPDIKWGEAVTAIVELKPDRDLEESELLRYCRERLDGIRAPKRVEIVDGLPRSPVGKVLKKELRRAFSMNGSARQARARGVER